MPNEADFNRRTFYKVLLAEKGESGTLGVCGESNGSLYLPAEAFAKS